MNTWQARASNISFLSLCFLSCFPLLGMKITVVAIIAFMAISIIAGTQNRSQIFAGNRLKEFFILLLPFLLIFTRTWVLDRSDGSLFYLEVSLSLVAFPIAFLLFNVSENDKLRSVACSLFAISSILMVLFGLSKAGLHILGQFGSDKTWQSYSQMFSDAAFPYQVRTVFEETVSVHPTHASVFMGISILVIISSLIRNYGSNSRGLIALQISALVLSVVMLAVLASRTPFIATMISAILLSFLHFRKKIYGLYVLGSVLVISVLLALLVPSFSERFREISIQNVQIPTQTNENSFNLRTGIYKCSMKTVLETPWWGLGPGNVQKKLNECYDNISREVYHGKNYNTHNQFLDYWAGLGIAGPVSLLLLMGWYAYINFRTRNHLALSIGLLFFISMLTENLLTRQNGVVPFAFFIGMFFYSGLKSETNRPTSP